MAGLPGSARHLLRASSRMEALTLEQVLARTRSIMADDRDVVAVAHVTRPTTRGFQRSKEPVPRKVCFNCNLPNHFAKDCLLRKNYRIPRIDSQRKKFSDRKQDFEEDGQVRCYRCNEQGHFASDCPGNDIGERPCAPVSSPKTM